MKFDYVAGYKYQLKTNCVFHTHIKPKNTVRNQFIQLFSNGLLFITKGYAWDGPSGPAIDTPSFMQASLVHDALYQLMREGLVDINYRKDADLLLYKIAREDGMWKLRALWTYWAVRRFAKSAITNKKKIIKAGTEL